MCIFVLIVCLFSVLLCVVIVFLCVDDDGLYLLCCMIGDVVDGCGMVVGVGG